MCLPWQISYPAYYRLDYQNYHVMEYMISKALKASIQTKYGLRFFFYNFDK